MKNGPASSSTRHKRRVRAHAPRGLIGCPFVYPAPVSFFAFPLPCFARAATAAAAVGAGLRCAATTAWPPLESSVPSNVKRASRSHTILAEVR